MNSHFVFMINNIPHLFPPRTGLPDLSPHGSDSPPTPNNRVQETKVGHEKGGVSMAQ